MLVASQSTRRCTASSTSSDEGTGSETAARGSGVTPENSKPTAAGMRMIGAETVLTRNFRTQQEPFRYASCVATPSVERELDATDHEIIALLCADARRPLADIA